MGEEAEVTINDHMMLDGDVMVIRVALTDLMFRMSQPDALGGDDMGRRLAVAYHERAKRVLTVMGAIEGEGK